MLTLVTNVAIATATFECPAPLPAPSIVVPAGCPNPPPKLSGIHPLDPELATRMAEGSLPVELTPSCPFDIDVGEQEHIYLKIKRTAGTTLRERFRFDMSAETTER